MSGEFQFLEYQRNQHKVVKQIDLYIYMDVALKSCENTNLHQKYECSNKNHFDLLWITKQSSARAFCGNVIAIAFAWKTSDPLRLVKNTFDILLISWKGLKIICEIANHSQFSKLWCQKFDDKAIQTKKNRCVGEQKIHFKKEK